MINSFIAACVQNTATPDIAANLADIEVFIRAAAKEGAQLVCLPEHFSCLNKNDAGLLEKALPMAEHPALPYCQRLAKELNIQLLLGSLAIKLSDEQFANRSFLLNNQGEIVAQYDKLHLFDVQVRDGQEYKESRTVKGGHRAVVAPTQWGGLGMSICYDVRFAYLFRALAQAGAYYLATPAAFTRITGEAHWHVLQRARAIETGCYVFAAGQCGTHEGGRQTFGHSLIVDPWGKVLADAGDKPAYIVAEVKPSYVEEVRQSIPALKHDRAIVFS